MTNIKYFCSEDSQAAILEYAAHAAAVAAGCASTSSLSSTGSMVYRLPRGGSASSNTLSAIDTSHIGAIHASTNDTILANRRIQQRYSLNANALSNLMPISPRESQSYDKIQVLLYACMPEDPPKIKITKIYNLK